MKYLLYIVEKYNIKIITFKLVEKNDIYVYKHKLDNNKIKKDGILLINYMIKDFR